MVTSTGAILTVSTDTILQKPTRLENLSEIADNKSGKYSETQVAEAQRKLNARELQAFGRFAFGQGGDGSAQGIKRFAEAYLKYLDQLSPEEEQNSDRYKGTRGPVTALLSQATSAAAKEQSAPGNKKPEDIEDPLLKLLRTGMQDIVDRLKEKAPQANGAANATIGDVVTISEAARKAADAAS